jgi:PKD repeat protein
VIGVSRILEKLEEARRELLCIRSGGSACPYPQGKLAAIEELKLGIRTEAETIKAKIDRLVATGHLASAEGDELKQKLEAVIGAIRAINDLLSSVGAELDLVSQTIVSARASLESADLAGADRALSEVRFWLWELSRQKEEVSSSIIAEIRKKLQRLNEELPTPWRLLGENLVGKAEGFTITPAQITALRAELAARLGAEPQLAGRRFTPAEIAYELLDLGGSKENILASNVITSALLSTGPNVGITLEAGSTGNTLVNNLITNEDLEHGRRGRFGSLTVGIELLTSGNRVLFNAIEFVNRALARGGPQEREDAKHLYLFQKLALARCQPAACPVPLARTIVPEVREESLRLSLSSARVVQNRIALNFLEENGIGIDVLDAESNTIDRNLFLNNTNDALRLASGAAVDIKAEKNDFRGNGAAVSNDDPAITVDVSKNYFGDPSGPFHEVRNPAGKGDQVLGRANVSPWASQPFCGGNFESRESFEELGISPFFWGGLPPNLALMPEKVILPQEKPRRCAQVFGGEEPGTPPAFPDKAEPPHDLNGDGLFEDANGNGRLDFDDAVTLALYLDWVSSGHHRRFDFNRNGRLDFDDAVRLAFNVGGQAAAKALLEMFGQLSLARVTTAFSSGGLRFVAEGTGIAALQVEVYNLGGKRVYTSGFQPGNQLAWNPSNGPGGAPLANGVYLYVVTVRGWRGEVLHSEVGKIVLRR